MRRPPDWVLPGACASGGRALRFGASQAALASALLGTVSCADNRPPTEPSPVASISVSVEASQILVGESTRASAVLKDVDGNVVLDRVATWTSVTPALISVGAGGEITGLLAGTAQVRASSGGVSGDAIVIVTNRLAATITLGLDSALITLPGGGVQLIAAVADATGKVIVNPAIVWTSSAPQIAAVNVAGLVTAVASGSAIISATLDGISATMAVTVRPAPVADAPTVTAISPPVLRPGAAYTVTGVNFGATPGSNQVLVDGLLATVLVATPTQLTVVLPTAGFVCEPTRSAFLQISANGRVGGTPAVLQTATRRELAVGEAAVVTNAAEVRCNELVPASGRWVVSVYNATRNTVLPNATGNVLFAIRGIPGPPNPVVVVPFSDAPGWTGQPALRARAAPPPAPAAAVPVRAAQDIAGRHAQAHVAMLERNLKELEFAEQRTGSGRAPPSAGATRAGLRAPDGPNPQLTTVGSITTVKIPNLDAADFCVANTAIGFRTVFVGPHVVVLEDTTTVLNGKPTQKGQVDSYYTRIGEEFEAAMWGTLTTTFGNPLAMDAALGGAGRVKMVFSPRVNTMQRGALQAFVASCDYFPVSQRPSSNLGAHFYAIAPASSATGYADPDSRDQWFRTIRSTIIHEVKHIVSFAERVSRGLAIEDLSWEEGSARIAEEIYARGFYGTGRGSNTRFSESVGCDITFAVPGPCADRPLLALRHFDGLYGFMARPELETPLGRAFVDNLNFYAGAWSFLRWAADHHAQNDAQFFRDFVTSPVTGTANIEARTGRRWEDLLGEWTLASYVDDIGGFTPQNARIGMPSWNHPDMWLGMCIEMGPCADPSNPVHLYLRSTPFAPRQRSFGNFLVGIGSMVGGGFTLLDLAGPGSSTQVIEVKSLISDADAPASVRLAFVRVR